MNPKAHDLIRAVAKKTNPVGDAKLRAAITRMTDSDKADYGGINITQDTINLQTTGKGDDFVVSGNVTNDYLGLIPRVTMLKDLTTSEFKLLLAR